MTKRHFQALAEAMSYCKPPKKGKAREVWEQAVRNVADVCSESNSLFDRGRFYSACGLTEDKR